MTGSILTPPAATTPAGLRGRAPAGDPLKGCQDRYDVIVIGSGLGGLTLANRLAKAGHRVLVLEQHYNFGGLATWFKRKNGHVFDISLHGFPAGMIKTCRKYWSAEIAEAIIPIRGLRFSNPEFELTTTYDRADFTRVLDDHFGVAPELTERFFQAMQAISLYDAEARALTTGELFERFFPGRTDVWRLLLEPIAYANGSTLEDPAVTFGIVFSNFMQKGVYTFRGGTDRLIRAMKAELKKNGVDLRNHAQVEKIWVEKDPGGQRRTTGVLVNGRSIRARAVVSNANLLTTIQRLAGEENFDPDYFNEAKAVRLNSSSCQVYLGIKKGESIPDVGDLFFVSSAPKLDAQALVAMECSSRTFSFYHPHLRPGTDRQSVVCSTNARHEDWARLGADQYLLAKERLARDTIAWLERFIPGVSAKIDHVEVATPLTFEFFTQHQLGASFGTKFEGLKVSQDLPQQVAGLFHAGSVGIIMSGWLGAANYGVIVANSVDRHLAASPRA